MQSFNENFIRLLTHLASISPQSVIGRHLSLVKLYIHNPLTQTRPIEGFIQHLLPYRTPIEGEDDAFFLTLDLQRIPGVDQCTEMILQDLIQIWKVLTPPNRKMVFCYLKGFCQLADEYQMK